MSGRNKKGKMKETTNKSVVSNNNLFLSHVSASGWMLD